MSYHKAGKKRILDIQELEELRDKAYENARIYKERTKRINDKKIKGKSFKPGMKVDEIVQIWQFLNSLDSMFVQV